MSFVVSLASDVVSVDAGATVPVGIELANQQESSDLFEIMIEGLDPEWASIPVESFTAEPGETQTQKVIFRVPRGSESAAGTYPFVIRARSLNSGESHTTQGVLEIKPFHQLSVDIEPKRQTMGGMNPQADFEVMVINLGNTEHDLQLFASDPENECAYSFEHEKIRIGPGQQRRVGLNVSSRKKAFLANGKLYGVGVSLRSLSSPNVAAYGQTQLELRPVVTPAPFFTVLTVAAIAVGWFLSIPKPPKVEIFQSDRQELKVGELAMLNFQTSGSSAVRLYANDELKNTSSVEAGSFEFAPTDPGRYTLRLEAMRGDKKATRTITLLVAPPDVLPPPEIIEFSVNKTKLTDQETLTIQFKVSPSVTRIEVRPDGLFPNPNASPLEFRPKWTGEQDVTLVAFNDAGETTQRAIRVTVSPAPIPKPTIAAFTLSSSKVFGPDAVVTIRWTLKNCTRAELEWNNDKIPVNAESGTYTLPVAQTGTLILRGFDATGKVIEQRKVLEWSPEPESTDPASPGGATPPPDSSPAPGGTGPN